MRDSYETDIGKLAYIGKQNVLCLLTESMYADNKGHTSPMHRISSLIKETLNKADGRIIFNVLSSHLYRIQELFNEVSKTNRKIVIMGKRLQNIVNNAITNNYLHIDKKTIGDLSNINDPNVIVLTSDEREKPYSNLLKIVNGYDKFIKIKPNDTIFIAVPLYEGREKTYYNLLNEISKFGADVITIANKKHLSYHASSEDLMMMIDLMKPKYYFPIRGEYYMQVANAEIASKVGIPNSNIILKQNGDVAYFENGVLQDTFMKIPNGNILIDGESSDDIGELVLKDREMLSDNGIMIISATLNRKTKKIIGGPEILTRGFVYVKDSTELLEELKKMCKDIILNNINNNMVEYAKIKTSIREELGKYLSIQTGNRPMIISVITEV